MSWTEVAEGVHLSRHEELDLTTGLVIGAERCLVMSDSASNRLSTRLR